MMEKEIKAADLRRAAKLRVAVLRRRGGEEGGAVYRGSSGGGLL
jgi:hypothetical protein